MEKSQMEILYDNYLKSDNQSIEKDGVTFYRLIKKEKVKIKGGMVLITVPIQAVDNINDTYCDENGKHIIMDLPVHMSFRDEIPEWYVRTVTLPVKNISEISEIGDYIGMISKRG